MSPISFPIGLDCILSRLRLIRSSMLTHIRSVSDALPFPIIADLGSKHADCPIFFIITIPKFITLGQIILSILSLVEKALRVSPNNKICCDNLFRLSLAVSFFIRQHKWFSTARGRFAMAYCFSALVKQIRKFASLRPPQTHQLRCEWTIP